MKSQHFILAFCLLTFSIDSFPQTSWPNRVRVNYTTSTNQFIDNIVIRFSSDPTVTITESFDWDARSLNCCTFIASIKDNVNFAIQTRPLAFNIDTVKLRVASTNAGDFKLLFTEFQSFTYAKNIFLIDSYTGTQQEIKANPSYSFSINSNAASQGTERFKLVFISEQLVLECPGNIVVNHAFGTNGANVLFSMYAPVAKCSNPFLNFSHLPNSFFPIGNTTVNVDAYDLCGNTANCSFVVTVKDVEPPLMSSPLPLYFSNNGGLAGYSFMPVAPMATDNHKLIGVQGVRNDSKALDMPYPIGTTTITWKATDSSGNSNVVMQYVTVSDTESPVIIASETPSGINALMANFSGCKRKITNTGLDPEALDNSSIVTLTNDLNNTNSLNGVELPFGLTNVLWTAVDGSGNTATWLQVLEVTSALNQVNIPDVVALPSGADANTIYLGYTPASGLSYNAFTAGISDYQWTSSSNLTINGVTNEPVVNITATALTSSPYTLTLSVTDILGCSAITTKQIEVVDISCGRNKVATCSPQGRDLCLSSSNITRYLLTGYQLGSCSNDLAKPAPIAIPEIKEASFKAFPNPGNGLVNLEFSNYQNTRIEIRISNVLGKMVTSKSMSISHSTETVKLDLQKNAAGVYNVQVITKDGVKSAKIVIAR